jgi:hypothetical protein
MSNQYADVATVRQRGSGQWQVEPPGPNAPVLFKSMREAIDYCVSQGWGVFLKKGR